VRGHTHLYLAPAAAGKTAYVLDLARTSARGLAAEPRVVVATHLQVRAARRRLAEMGGAMGVRVLTFDQLYAELLAAAGEIYTTLSEPVQFRLIRAILGSPLAIQHYAPLIDRPGFIQVLLQLIAELKAAGVHPDAFAWAIHSMGDEARLAELARIYSVYQSRLQAQNWADRAGLGWLAVEAIDERAPHAAREWPLLAVDGFDSFTPVQVALLSSLAGRVRELVMTLTGDPVGGERSLAHRRFALTRHDLEGKLQLHAEPLPSLSDFGTAWESPKSSVLTHLERRLFRPAATHIDGAPGPHGVAGVGGAVEMIEAPDRPSEVRAALRWLKARLLLDGCRPGEVALLARSITPYRSFIQQTAAEFGVPIQMVAGLPLRENPAVTALLGLFRLVLPGDDGEPALPRRSVVEAWRSPYFDWSALPAEDATEPIGIRPGDADDLDAVARWGRVIGGRSQWDEALGRLATLANADSEDAAGPAQDEERGVPQGLPRGDAARRLAACLGRFVQRLTPPAREHTCREFVGWLEDLIGSEEIPLSGIRAVAEARTSLRVVAQARQGDRSLADRDVAALVALKDVLRGLVWAEKALSTPPVTFTRWAEELFGAVDVASYHLPVRPDRDEMLVANVLQSRGLPFRAVAVLGLAEGEFPATLSEDPFLRDADRGRLRDEFHFPLELSTQGAEAEFFYETVTRPDGLLLLTRPRLADNGAPWQASPFWEEVRRLVSCEPDRLTGESTPMPAEAASWPELLESLAAHTGYAAVKTWSEKTAPGPTAAVAAAAKILRVRRRAAGPSSFDGDLSSLDGTLALRFAPERSWSPTRLETYLGCPFSFFVTYALGLEAREEPVEGLNSWQLGNIYHRILERLYDQVADPASADALLAALPAVAEAVLDDAPASEGFRAAAWWSQTRTEIAANVERSVVALAEPSSGYVPVALEAAFGGAKALVVNDGEDSFRLRGVIDRVDRAPGGGLRVIDYKTAGPSAFTNKALEEGKKLQLPLYALAAEEALGLGEVIDGFYWHVRQAEASKLALSTFADGPAGAIEVALAHAWLAVREVRAGHFVPHPPDGGCPDYCPAAGFCWYYRPRWSA
jgi:ATP-dependent helicase/nuclease subunit B